MTRNRAFALVLALAAAGFAATVIPWEDLTEGDWLYAVATRFALVDGHKVHYPTPTAELARLLEASTDPGALRHLAEARLALGDRKGALETLERWAQAAGPQAWAETARWEMAHHEPAAAFKAAERAMPGLGEGERRALGDERLRWAQDNPGLADPIALMQARAALFPGDVEYLEAWLRALEGAKRLDEADRALAAAQALPPERRLLVRSDLKADHGDHLAAYRILDEAVMEPWSPQFSRAYAARVDKAAATAPGAWRAALEAKYDAGALVRLFTYFQGSQKLTSATELLRQVERRYEASLDRQGEQLLSRLYAGVDAAPEAFRAGLAAAHLGTKAEQTGDLATLAQLALRAGGRPLAWGAYNDEAYRWVAAVDRTPGFWSGGVSFLLTGLAWKETLDNLEAQSLPDRTFATARALTAALAERDPRNPALPSLRVAIMARHVERGEGRQALDLLPLVEPGPPDLADQARAQALLAARQTPVPLAEEERLMKARLKHAAPDGSRPALDDGHPSHDYEPQENGETPAWARLRTRPRAQGYLALLNELTARLDHLDASHRASVDLILTELDRLPDAERLWLHLAERLEGWNLDEGLAPRYQQALQRFQEPGVWDRAARWYARHGYHAELRQLAADVTARFRGSELFSRGGAEVAVQVPDQPPLGMGVRMVAWADWVRLKALERFPHSPEVFREAGRLVTPAQWQAHYKPAEEARKPFTKVIVPEHLLEERRWAILFVDAGQREAWFADAMRKGALEDRLTALEARADRTPVEDQLLFEGWARLSRFERAVAPGERLCASYPGDGALAQRLLSLHRSLNGLETSHAAPARALVERTAPALENPNALWTELGEMEEDRGRGAEAMALWRNLLAREPRNPDRIAELATLLWDYNHDPEALAVVEAGRKALDRPRFFAFETGVLRENLRDLEGAVREYLDATRPEKGGYGFFYENDQRALRRLAQLLAKPKVYALVERRIKGLAPGNAEDEKTLGAFWPLGTISTPDPGLTWDADTWIDGMDQPSDAVGRARREARKGAERPAQFDAIRRIGDLMLDKLAEMVPRATDADFLGYAGSASYAARDRWPEARLTGFTAAILARRAQLAPTEEERLTLEMERAEFLAEKGRTQDADTVWEALAPRLDKLPEGSVKLKAESRRAAYLERAKGVPEATAEWRRITARHAWSLGLLEDRLAFLDRTGQGAEARALLEETVPRAASGHRENLLEQLTRASLAASDLPRARRAVEQLLARDGLEDARRLAAAHLLARLSFREEPGWDPFPLAKAQAALLKPEVQADLYHELARAADLENAAARGVALWIEALNRRTERAWLVAAARSTRRLGRDAELLAFFEKQRERSPRDMRWAVAVRDLKRFGNDVEGAVEAAKAAVTVRPEEEILWREAAEILVRADRVHEAADFLEGWNRPRPGSEDVARWRSELYAQAGDPARAFAIERDALKAFAREGSAEDKADRRKRAALRLFHLGHPDLAVRLYSPTGDAAALASVPGLPAEEGAAMALLLGQFPRYASACLGRQGLSVQAGTALARHGRPEQKDEVQAWLAGLIFPAGAARPLDAALDRWWPFIGASGLEPGLRVALAQRLLAARPGPWQAEAPFPFLQRAGQDLVVLVSPATGSEGRMAFREPDLPRLWASDLARRDRGEELMAFVEPRWQELLAQVRGPGPAGARMTWASWLDEPSVLQTWTRAAAQHPEKVKELGDLMGERGSWDRFWALAARGWSADTLVAILPEGPRTAWFRFWEPAAQDPVLLARRDLVEKASNALVRLVQNAPGGASSPLVDRLRGPRTVGDVLGKDPRWLWPDFTPRRDARGGLLEQGDDRITGQGVDQGRVPGALWGERPGEAWYVLEALARYRQGDPTAPYLPLETGQRGSETQRVLLAMRLAKAMGDLPAALALAEARPGPAKDRGWLEGRLDLLAAAGRREEAAQVFQAYVRSTQGAFTEAAFQDLSVLAARLGLPSPMDCLDPARAVGPVFLAYLQDRRSEAARGFHTDNPVDFRTALRNRWSLRPEALTRAQARFWLHELWATGSANLPRAVLAKVGPVWPHASSWLGTLPVPGRPAALAALEQALEPGTPRPALLAELTAPKAPEAHRLLALRIRLARNETEPAFALVDAMVAELGAGNGLAYEPAPPPEPPPAEGEEGGETERPEMFYPEPLVARLEAWLAPFRGAARSTVEAKFLKVLAQKRQDGAISADSWKLAFQLTPAADAPALARELEEAWFRGEVDPHVLGTVLEAAAPALKGDLPRWLSRWVAFHTYDQARRKAALWARLKQPAEALRALLASRARDPWTAREEARAFDLWRSLGPAPGVKVPDYWTGAAAVWSGAAPLEDRLKAHPHDVLAARAALRNLGPGDENAMARARAVLEADRTWGKDLESDAAILRLRAARALLPRSPAAAHLALGGAEPEGLARILAGRTFRAADVNGALADLARIAARTERDGEARRSLALLADRGAPGLQALQAELAPAPAKAVGFRMEGGRPVPLKPRDLTWALLANVLKQEGQ